jgi:hypothetical protein
LARYSSFVFVCFSQNGKNRIANISTTILNHNLSPSPWAWIKEFNWMENQIEINPTAHPKV